MRRDSYVCDRCGKDFSGFLLRDTPCHYGIAKVAIDDHYDIPEVARSWDLCSKCMDEFIEWAKGDGE